MREISYKDALNEALKEEMERDESVFCLGEDLTPYGGAFGVTTGLLEKFGRKRVLDTAISEAAIVGAAVGASITGKRAIAELQFSDFITIGCDQLVNQAAKIHYMHAGGMKVPMVLRAPVGGYLSAGPQHSQNFEAWFSHVPGLKVVLPATPYDAKGLLKSAIRDDNPVVFLEHKVLYNMKGPVPQEEYLVPLGKAEIRKRGTDVTLVTYSYMVHLSLSASQKLKKKGISIEIIDLRTIDPLDEDLVMESVSKTGRVVLVQEAPLDCGVGAEVAARIAENAFAQLKAPIVRVGAKDTPVPFSPLLEKYILPQEKDIIMSVEKVIDYS